MKRATLYTYKHYFSSIARIFIRDCDFGLIEVVEIDRFYKVTSDWVIIYETGGGQGIGYSPSNVIRRIYIGDMEFDTVDVDRDSDLEKELEASYLRLVSKKWHVKT
jgi:hypothetical protein